MKQRKGDGIFLVFDLGGGTLDIAIAESISGRVSLLAHGGVAMCGGTDFDRSILDNTVKPWLIANFVFLEDLSVNPKYKSLLRMCLWAAEKAKIELSAKEEVVISLPESDIGICDESDTEVYIDIPFSRKHLDELIAGKVDEAIQSARETLEKAGLSPHDFERIVFVGGPTHYTPLRDRVCFELGIPAGKKPDGSPEVNPMTAVAEGAAVFTESIDWASQSRGRKNTRGTISAGSALALSSITPLERHTRKQRLSRRLVVKLHRVSSSKSTAWTRVRHRVVLKDGAAVELASDNQKGDII
jgi:molecular chaperone DnaK